ncbi:hypothetical protein L6452_15930 [Arctium lappa]|uniref:Uncharacterized protein n=1 Tax=Arctium lappa TaxID=4217 RepID=A0ACB9CQ77_ARCLA|nr:hypothetical protein L6452_15930 [Arctium lappa]
MADAAVEFLLNNLTQLLVYNVHLISSVKDQVNSLCTDLRLLAAFVKDATDSRDKSAVVKQLVKEIRIEVYKAEDIIDMFVVHASVQNSRTTFKKLFHITEHTKKLHSIGKEIQDIRRRVKDLYDNKLFGYIASGGRESVTRSPPAVEEDNVVGFDKEAEEMVGWLKAETEELDVISVLRHVYTSAASNLPTPSSKSRKGVKDPLINENLRTMSKVSPKTCTDVIFARTPNLQKLGVRGNLMSLMEETDGSCKFDNITKLTHLETLKLLNDTYPISPLDGRLRGLLEWYKFPPKLKKLTLSDTMLNWENMSVLGKLPGLEVLKLGDNAFMGERWETPERSFVRLRVLEIGKTDLAIWKAAGVQFPQLQRLSLKQCEQLVAVPWGLGGIPTLEVVELCWTSHSTVASAHRIQKSFKLVVFPPDQLETQT